MLENPNLKGKGRAQVYCWEKDWEIGDFEWEGKTGEMSPVREMGKLNSGGNEIKQKKKTYLSRNRLAIDRKHLLRNVEIFFDMIEVKYPCLYNSNF